jgi:hypothetical protein
MRTYIHLSRPDDAHLVKARAALWEWEAQLGRVRRVRLAVDDAGSLPPIGPPQLAKPAQR